jgi:hypothetical protein
MPPCADSYSTDECEVDSPGTGEARKNCTLPVDVRAFPTPGGSIVKMDKGLFTSRRRQNPPKGADQRLRGRVTSEAAVARRIHTDEIREYGVLGGCCEWRLGYRA